jgi:hypothetical protein
MFGAGKILDKGFRLGTEWLKGAQPAAAVPVQLELAKSAGSVEESAV